MSEAQAVEQEVVENAVVEETEVVEEYTDEELQAMEHGWSPKDEWKGDPDDWVNARTFNKRGELFGKIRDLERRLDNQKSEFSTASKAMVDMLKKAKETEYNRAVKELKKQKRSAIEEGETAVAFDIDDQIEELTHEHKSAQEQMDAQMQQAPQQPDPAFQDWVVKNDWYNSDTNMRMTADSIGMRYAQENPSATLQQVFAVVDEQMKRVYPEKFENVNKPKATKVNETSTRGKATGSRKSKYGVRDLSDEQKTIMNTMVRSGVMSQEEYIDELARIGEIGG